MTTSNKEALAKAMRERRDELRLSQQAAADLSKDLDLRHLADHGYNIGSPGKKPRRDPGVSLKTWSNLEQCESDHPYPHTLRVVDAVLDWPERPEEHGAVGTAEAILYGLERPSGPSYRARLRGDEPEPEPLVENPTKEEVLKARLEIEVLRGVVAEVATRQDNLQEMLNLILQALRPGGDGGDFSV